jgi:hypothetical protein
MFAKFKIRKKYAKKSRAKKEKQLKSKLMPKAEYKIEAKDNDMKNMVDGR